MQEATSPVTMPTTLKAVGSDNLLDDPLAAQLAGMIVDIDDMLSPESVLAEPNAAARWGTREPVEGAHSPSPTVMSDEGLEAELDAILDRELASPTTPTAAPSFAAAGVAIDARATSWPADLDNCDIYMNSAVRSLNEPLFNDLAGSAWQPEMDLYSLDGLPSGAGLAEEQAVLGTFSGSPLRPTRPFAKLEEQMTQDK